MVANEWLAGVHAEDRRRFVHLLAGSLVAHLLVVVLLGAAPSPAPPAMPAVLRVNLIAGLPAPRATRRPPSPAPPVPNVEPRQVVPKVEPRQVVLPEQAPRAVPSKKRTPPPARREPIEYDDALAQLRNELGEQTPPEPGPSSTISDAEVMATTAPADATGSSAAGAIDPELARWALATQRHIRRNYVTPPEFLGRGLATVVEVELTALGDVIGSPRVVRPSGDPFFDDNAVRAVMKSTPLPVPPGSGTWTFSFSED